MENAGKVVSKKEVTETLVRNIVSDQAEFKEVRQLLRHGQKDRLIEAMATYPLLDENFDESEPELRTAYVIWKRISDSLVALGTEAAIEGIINGFAKSQQQNEANSLTEGVANVETTEG
jgi:flagellar motor component MotA